MKASNILVVKDSKVLSEVSIEVCEDEIPVGGRKVPVNTQHLDLARYVYGQIGNSIRVTESGNCSMNKYYRPVSLQ